MPIKTITLVGPAYPYRGGLATIIHTLARTFSARGARAGILTFTVQYPDRLFPGKSQYSDSPPPEGLDIERAVSTVDPTSWLKVGRRLRREAPDVVLMKYWTPFMAPALGTIARLARGNGHTKVLVQVDNVIPHEHFVADSALTSYFLHSVDGFIYMSEQVHQELREFTPRKPALFSPHPLFSNFGEKMPRELACELLNIDPGYSYSLFFGLIRDYKGLDLLLDAWAELKAQGRASRQKLIIAGEFYNNKGKYIDQIGALGLLDDIVLHDYFIPDEQVRRFFSAADCLILPYRSATQSGVTQIAYHFQVPIIVTRVGGLAETVADGVVGYVCEATAPSLAQAIGRMREEGNVERFSANMEREKSRFSWEATADTIEELYDDIVRRGNDR